MRVEASAVAKIMALQLQMRGAEALAGSKKNSFAEVFNDSLCGVQPRTRESLFVACPLGGSFRITGFFGEDRGSYTHKGVDLAAPEGAPVRAFAPGRVLGSESPAGGKEVFVTGKDGNYYAHLGGYAVGSGTEVRAGDIIGYVGSTGRSTGPHLHFGIKRGEKWVDPLPELREAFEEASRETGLSVRLLEAVAEAESGLNPRAVSPAGALGLMQLMPETARALGVRDPFDLRENVLGGARYLRGLLDRYGGDLVKALAAYNAGPGAVDRYGGVPPYRETQEYVKKILGKLA